MTVGELVETLQAHGWRVIKSDESGRQLRHDVHPGLVTLSGRAEQLLPHGLLRGLLRYVEIEERR